VLISTSVPKVDDNNIIILFMSLNLSLYLWWILYLSDHFSERR
jgi:hypothetical protein